MKKYYYLLIVAIAATMSIQAQEKKAEDEGDAPWSNCDRQQRQDIRSAWLRGEVRYISARGRRVTNL